jgi:adenylate cyclase
MYFRIGINSGDVIEEGDLIYGDGVNIAARVESLAKGGGISLSGTAYDQLGKKLPLGYEYLGEQSVKNIEKPVRVYRVLTEAEAAGKVIGEKWPKPIPWRWAALAVALIVVVGGLAIWSFYFRPPPMEVASKERMAFPLPDKPSIAVLPFVNMSEDPKQEYFSDGLTEEIITALSKVPKLFVIARNSTFSYKGKSVKINQVAEDLGVQYVLEGSVRKSEDRVRITAQLIDALSGHHLWAERYEKDLRDIFALQDEITLNILQTLQVKLTADDQYITFRKGTDNLQAYLKILEAREYATRSNKEGYAMAGKLAEEAITLDPDYPGPYLMLSAAHLMEIIFGTSKSPKQSLKMAEELVQKALALDDHLAEGYAFLGRIYLTKRQYEKAITAGERACDLAPNSSFVHAALGFTLRNAGRPEEAITYFKKAIRLNPFPPAWYLTSLGGAYLNLGRHEEAIAEFKKGLQLAPESVFSRLGLAAAYSELGREEHARVEAAEVLKLDPKFTLVSHAKGLLYKNKDDKDRYLAALRKAGLPAKPPLPLPDKPSIAVLPFANIGNPEKEYIADGITEQIITALARNPSLFVIASNSTFTYKGKPVMVQQVSRELGVRYVVEGSVQKSGDRIRITAQLIDATTGEHIWAENYDRGLKDIFALQDEITIGILKGTMGKLLGFGDQSRVKGTTNVEAYLKYLKARPLSSTNERNNRIAQQLLEESIALDPDYALAYASLGVSYCAQAMNRWSPSPGKDLQRALELAQKAIDLDQNLFVPHGTLGWIYLIKGKHDEAIAEAKKAVDLAPNNAWANGCLGTFLAYADRPDEAILVSENALRLNPFPTDWDLLFAEVGYFMAGRYEEALAYTKKAQERNPDNMWSYVYQAGIYGHLGREEEARAAAKQILRLNPKFSLEQHEKAPFFKNRDKWNLHINGLRKAGLE